MCHEDDAGRAQGDCAEGGGAMGEGARMNRLRAMFHRTPKRYAVTFAVMEWVICMIAFFGTHLIRHHAITAGEVLPWLIITTPVVLTFGFLLYRQRTRQQHDSP